MISNVSDGIAIFGNTIKIVSDGIRNFANSIIYPYYTGIKTNLGDILFLDYAKLL